MDEFLAGVASGNADPREPWTWLVYADYLRDCDQWAAAELAVERAEYLTGDRYRECFEVCYGEGWYPGSPERDEAVKRNLVMTAAAWVDEPPAG